ncbi:ATP-binding cassette domain-containing protein, partial [Kribbella sp. NPDC002412]
MNSIEQGATGGVQDPAIVVRELSVHGVELDELRVRRGEIVALLGANGTGKSTVSRVLVGATAAAGSARVLGLDPTDDHAELKCRIGFLIQDLETMGSLSSRDVLDICAAVRGCSASYAVTLAERIALDLDRPMGQLCRGQLRRLGVVQALMHRPEVIVLDDPTAELDAPGRLALAKLLREAAAWGAAVLITVTTAAEAAEYADRTATFDRRAVPAAEPAPE